MALLRLRANSVSVGAAEIVVVSSLVVSPIEVVADSTAEVLELVNLVNWPNALEAPTKRRPEDERMIKSQWVTVKERLKTSEWATKRECENMCADDRQPEPERYGSHWFIYI